MLSEVPNNLFITFLMILEAGMVFQHSKTLYSDGDWTLRSAEPWGGDELDL